MADPKQQLASFQLAIGMDNVSFDETVQPMGERAMLVESRNTRLSKTPGMVSKAPGSSTTTVGIVGRTRCFGVVPCGASRSSISYQTPYGDYNRVNLPSDSRRLSGVSSQAQPQSSYRPARVVRAEAEAMPAMYGTPAMAYDSVNGWTFKAYTAADVLGAVCALYVTVTDASGGVIVPPAQVVSFAGRSKNFAQWFGLSAHGISGVVLWYRDNTSTVIRASKLSIGVNYVMTVAAPVAIFTPLSCDSGEVGLAYDPEDLVYAYLITRDSAVAGSIAYHRVDIILMSVTTVVAASGGAAGDYLSIAYVNNAGTQYLAIAHTRAAGTTTVRRLDPATLASSWAASGPATYGRPSLAWYQVASTSTVYLVTSVDNPGTTVSAANPGGVEFTFHVWSSGASGGSTVPVPWAMTAGQAVTHKASTSEMYPLFTLAPMYAVDALITSVNFLEDPSIEVYTPHFTSYAGTVTLFANIVARFGVDTAMRQSVLTLTASNVTFMQGDEYHCAYLTELIGYDSGANGFPARTIVIDFGVGQPRYALDSAGTALVAAAMPTIWDGGYVTEMSPVRKPKLYVAAAGGGAAALSVGTYQFSAVVSWRDAQGKLHRSPPASPITLVLGAPASPIVYVTHQPSYRDIINQGQYTVTVYATEVDGVTLYAQPYTQTAIPGPFWYEVTNVAQPIFDASTIPLYSDDSPGTAIASYCLGAVRDFAVISDRAWAVCAENRARAYYSKPAEPGVAFEFEPSAMFIDMPASAGELLAVTSYRDAPLFMTTTGIWTVAGDGPDALLSPPLFSACQQASDVPCTSTASVVSSPVGVLFQSGDRYALFAGQVQIFPNIAAYPVVNTAVFRKQHEVVLLLESGTAYVYNYQRNAWSFWHTDTLEAGGVVAAAAQESVDGPVLLFSEDLARMKRLDPETVSTNAQIYLETGWVVLGGPQDDNRITNLVLHAKRAGAHALSMTIATDYGASQPVKSMTAAEVASAAVNNSRYDMWAEPKVQVGRAVKLVIAESGAVGEAFQPVNLTVELMKTPGKLTQSLLKSGRK